MRRVRHSFALGVGLALAGLFAVTPAVGQYAPSIPFSPFSYPYQSFSYPTIVNPAIPNSARFNAGGFGPGSMLGAPVVMDMSSTLPALDSYGSAPRAGRFTPYYAAFRTPERFTTAIANREQEYQDNLTRREEIFFQLQNERDEERRTELMNELQTLNTALNRANMNARRQSASGAGSSVAPAAAAGVRASRGTALDVPRADAATSTPRLEPVAPTTPPSNRNLTIPSTRRAPRSDAELFLSPVPNTVLPGAGTALPPALGPTTAPRQPLGSGIDPDSALERSRRLNTSGISGSNIERSPLDRGVFDSTVGRRDGIRASAARRTRATIPGSSNTNRPDR